MVDGRQGTYDPNWMISGRIAQATAIGGPNSTAQRANRRPRESCGAAGSDRVSRLTGVR
jgi:hypothetical protein